LPGTSFGSKRVVDRRQYLLLDLAQGNSVISFFAGQFFYRKIIRKINDHQPWLARFQSD
jgi:hypothetical protein